eukprot:gnl/MRDRNA2_/MRDRNA2_127141_c0_seq1.p1 gnl/MRDRNA2_/MRDRNA2_127141_c0~~gnl/MRDRNA2_/MRDRNA2_127141_c0_seq1.p1  ORF type:complete len:776 (-),score=140.64 gnl/MRDRNA2_/MRDRNA2_127141_c0_seq1:124-2451(-)
MLSSWRGYQDESNSRQYSEEDLSSLITSMSLSRHWEAAFIVMDENKHRLDHDAYVAGMGACARHGGHWDKAISLLAEMRSRNIEPAISAWNCVFNACTAKNNWEKALSVLDEVRRSRCRPNQATYNILISGVGKGKQWEKCLTLLHDMRAERLQPDCMAYNAMIAAFDRSGGRWLDALHLLQEMRKQDIQPDTIAYSSAISCCATAGNWITALSLLEEMNTLSVEANKITYCAAMTACGRGQQLEKTMALLMELQFKQLRPNVVAYNAAVDACKNSGRQWQRAIEIIVEMQESRVLPNVITYSTAISACAFRQDASHVGLALFDEMQEKRLAPNTITYTAAIHACGCKVGLWQRALELLDDMSQKMIHPNRVTYTAVLQACAAGGEPNRTLALLAEIRMRGLNPDEGMYLIALDAVIAADQSWQQAVRLMSEMREKSVQPSAAMYSSMLDGFEKSYSSKPKAVENQGLWERALRMVKEAHGKNLVLATTGYSSVIKLLADSNQQSKAYQIWNDVQSLSVQPDENLLQCVLSSCSQFELAGVTQELEALKEKKMQKNLKNQLGSEEHICEPKQESCGILPVVDPEDVSNIETIPEPEPLPQQGAAQGSSWERAVAILMDLMVCGVCVEDGIYASAINYCMRAEKASVAVDILRSAYEHGLHLDSESAKAFYKEFQDCPDGKSKASGEKIIKDLVRVPPRNRGKSVWERLKGVQLSTLVDTVQEGLRASQVNRPAAQDRNVKKRSRRSKGEIMVVGLALLLGHYALEAMNIMPWSSG